MQQYSETIYVELSCRTTGSIYLVGDFEPAEYVHYFKKQPTTVYLHLKQ